TIPSCITIAQDNGQLLVSRASDMKDHRSLHGLTRALVANMVNGVSQGFEKKLELVGTGYRASVQNKKLVLAVGYSHPVEITPPEGIEFETPTATKITVRGIDKEKVGNIAASIREVNKPEPYKGKGIKYENEVIRRKAGKAGKK
ncbi:MAG: 50S ribosomal protein L6, partial [Syntrophomonadaceae bacterium]|nr:50S ribosomal protein L6 [Syntrophomonadaceae bacterium]